MPNLPNGSTATPRLTVRLYKTISRKTVDGKTAVSARYEGKAPYINLTPFLGDGSSVRTTKSVRDPAGGFSITIPDQPQRNGLSLESLSGLIEPMDLVEIRMWSGIGAWSVSDEDGPKYPIIMRGFVSEIQGPQGVDDTGRPQRSVTITGQDYGKIWQTFQVIYLAAYAERKALLTSFNLWDLFGADVRNAMASGEFVRQMIAKVINPHLDGFMPRNTPMPRQLKTGDSISVKHGVINNSYHGEQGSIYDILKKHGDVGVWNELYTEDREDGVHVVYRAIPALHLTAPSGSKDRRIQSDAPELVYVEIPDDLINNMSTSRSDANVANFYWVGNSRYDLIDDMQRKLASIPAGDSRVSLREYPNTAVKYYGVRLMQAETQQGDDAIVNMTTDQKKVTQDARTEKQEAWIDKRRRLMMEMNRDNVVFERGTVRMKGGPLRTNGEAMKAGDYARLKIGRMTYEAYVIAIDHDFQPLRGYTTTLTFERGTRFVERARTEATLSPWLSEQALRGGGV